MGCRSCQEFSRARLLRQAAAQAGSGLPLIEPGMPIPAGTGLDRRSFLLRSGMAMLSVYGASRLGFAQLEEGIARAQGTTNPVLVNVFMEGGVDSLSLLAPVNDSRYRQWRPNLALGAGAGTPFAEDDRLRWHPAAMPFDTLHGEGKVSVFPAIGYSGADQSHFTSRHYWEVGELRANTRTGWMGRLLDAIGTDDNPLQGLAMDGWLSPTLATASKPVAAIDGPGYELWAPGVWSEVEELMFDAVASVGEAQAAGGDPARTGAGQIAAQAMRLRTQLAPFGNGQIVSPVTYPDVRFGENLAALAAMLEAGMPISCVSVQATGAYDTHDSQRSSLGDDLGSTAQAILAFQRDLEARDLDGRVITLVWSEFGRRPQENGSGEGAGTDHGAAGTALLIGSRARGQMIGEWPGLATLDEDDNIRHTSDFRALYCSLLEQWFDHDASSVIPGAGGFARPALIAAP